MRDTRLPAMYHAFVRAALASYRAGLAIMGYQAQLGENAE